MITNSFITCAIPRVTYSRTMFLCHHFLTELIPNEPLWNPASPFLHPIWLLYSVIGSNHFSHNPLALLLCIYSHSIQTYVTSIILNKNNGREIVQQFSRFSHGIYQAKSVCGLGFFSTTRPEQHNDLNPLLWTISLLGQESSVVPPGLLTLLRSHLPK